MLDEWKWKFLEISGWSYKTDRRIGALARRLVRGKFSKKRLRRMTLSQKKSIQKESEFKKFL